MIFCHNAFLPQATESKSGLVKTICFTSTCIKVYNPFLVTYRLCVVRVEPTAARRDTFVIPSQKSAACQRRRKHGRTRPIGLYKTSCVEKFRSNLKCQRIIITSFKSWCKLFCDIGQRAKYVNVRAFQSLCFFLIINFQVNKRTGVE